MEKKPQPHENPIARTMTLLLQLTGLGRLPVGHGNRRGQPAATAMVEATAKSMISAY
jgi:hypothetical protein